MRRLGFIGTASYVTACEFNKFCLQNLGAVRRLKFSEDKSQVLAIINLDAIDEEAYNELTLLLEEIHIQKMDYGIVKDENVISGPQVDPDDIYLEEAYRRATDAERYYHENLREAEKTVESALERNIKNYIETHFSPNESQRLSNMEVKLLAQVYMDPLFYEMSVEQFTQHVEESDDYDMFAESGSKRQSYTRMRLKIESMLHTSSGWSTDATIGDLISAIRMYYLNFSDE